jgi:hypothetical protein
MSCMIAPPAGHGGLEDLPLSLDALDSLSRTGLEVMTKLLEGREQTRLPLQQFTGAASRPDHRLFYLTILAPEQAGPDGWKGAFYAPFGHFHICGTVQGAATDRGSVSLTAETRLVVGGRDLVTANWTVVGPDERQSAPNHACLLESIEIGRSGPHVEEDIRRCIARHAPERASGTPKAVVTFQCAVAAACLIEAIC